MAMYVNKDDKLNDLALRNQATRVLERELAEQRSRLAAKLDAVGGPSTPESVLLCYDPITRV